MRTFVEILNDKISSSPTELNNQKKNVNEITTTSAIPSDAIKIPDDVIKKWNKTLDYGFKMRRKFTYYDVVFKTKRLNRGYKGHLTRTDNDLRKAIEFHKLDPHKTVKQLYHLYPPKYF